MIDNLPRGGHPNKFLLKSDCALLRETQNNRRATSQAPQASLSILNIKVHESAIRRRQLKYDIVGSTQKRNPLLSKKDRRESLKFKLSYLPFIHVQKRPNFEFLAEILVVHCQAQRLRGEDMNLLCNFRNRNQFA